MRHGLKEFLQALTVTLSLCLGAPAAAQSFDDYGLLGGASQGAERPPDLEAYGQIAETYRAGSALDMTQRQVSRFRERVKTTLMRLPRAADDIGAAVAGGSPGGDGRFFIGLAAFLVFLLGVGRAVATLFAVYVGRPVFMSLQKPHPQGLCDKLPVLAARVGLTVAGLAITLATAVLVGSGFYPEDNEVALRTAIIVFAAYGAVRLVDTLWRMILAPFLRDYRVPVIEDRAAVRLYRWLYAGALIDIALSAALYWLDTLGLQPETAALLTIATGMITTALVAAGGWVNRHAVSGAILGGKTAREASWLSVAFATLWGPALLVYLAVTLTVLAYRAIMAAPLGPPPLGVAFAVFMAALVAYALTVFAVERLARRQRARLASAPHPEPVALSQAEAMAAAALGEGPGPRRDLRADGPSGGPSDAGDDEGDDEGGGFVPQPKAPPPPPGSRSSMRTFEDLARRVASLFALGAAIWALTYLWGGREAFAPGAPLDVIQGVIDILFIGYVSYHAVRIWIDRRIEAEGGDDVVAEPGDEGGAFNAASRLATLLPLIRNFVLILILLAVAIFIMMEIGVNVAPLLGGAGVIGLAIGFGSQTLIRDILSGAFFLIDDAFRKGEYIDIGGVKGTVEQISIRSFQLRHHLGALNTVPFGEIKHLTNYSRDWVMMKLPLRLTYDTDPEKVRKLIKKLGERLLEHPTEGRKFLQPLKSQGVFMMEDSAMIMRVKYMTKPGDQWTTRKLVYQEIRELFEREGIHFAHREVTVRVAHEDGDPERSLSPGEMKAIGAAARTAVDEADALAAARPRAVGDDR